MPVSLELSEQSEAAPPIYGRVLLKVSGEALMGPRDYGLDPETVDRLASEVRSVHQSGVQVCLVIGGGNIFRGLSGAAPAGPWRRCRF